MQFHKFPITLPEQLIRTSQCLIGFNFNWFKEVDSMKSFIDSKMNQINQVNLFDKRIFLT